MSEHTPAHPWLEDLSVGQRFVSRPYPVTAEDIVRFARQFDPLPIHLDAEAGSRSVFQGLVASGWHTAAITMRLMVEKAPFFGDGTIGLQAELTWPAPTRPGDTLRAAGEIIAITPSRSGKPRGVVTIRVETRNQDDRVVQTLTSRVLVPARPARGSP